MQATSPGRMKQATSSMWPLVSSGSMPSLAARAPSRSRDSRSSMRSIAPRSMSGFRPSDSRHISVGEHGALAVDVDGAALEHEALGAVGIDARRSRRPSARPESSRSHGKYSPSTSPPQALNVQSTARTPPLPLTTKRRPAVADPGVVARHLDDAHGRAAGARAHSGTAPAETR